ncbi:hypothetical protein ACFSL6_26315 [Paenibacillus thailandensis]
MDTYRNSILRPLEYALWVNEQKKIRKAAGKTAAASASFSKAAPNLEIG